MANIVEALANRKSAIKGREAIADNINKLINGEIETPLQEIEGINRSAKNICNELERLRQAMLSERIKHEEQVDGFNDKIAGVAHDFKTPLATICGYAECIQDGIDDKDYPELISERARAMNEQVIDLVASIRADREERNRTCVDAYGFFGGVFKYLTPIVEEKKIKFNVKTAPKVKLYVDKKQITRVCQNIVSNAVKATPSGGEISVKFRTDGKFLFIKIKDNGCGIKKADKQFVFDKFFMADKSRGSGNSGLGLYIVKEFVEAHGGSVSVKTKVNRGTTFTVALPIVYEESKLPATRRFERCSMAVKLPIVLIFVIFFPFFFRLVRFFETFKITTIITALLLTVPFFLVFWFVDFFSILVYGKITFLAD